MIALKRMDGANLGTLQAATLKATTALKLGLSSGTFLEECQPNIPVATPFISAGFTLLSGVKPIKRHGEVIGAIAVSGTGNEKSYTNTAFVATGFWVYFRYRSVMPIPRT